MPITDDSIRRRLEAREDTLSPYAARSAGSQGRAVPEEASLLRTDYQRDRDRIIHCKAFRRLKHKTQVFIAPLGDHYVTRLSHTLEVSQIARTIARALNLNEDLAEAIAMGHDMGHTPFGHIGEDELNSIHPSGFRHSNQSLRIVDQIEKDGQGLNLTWEVRQGIVLHSKPRGNFLAGVTDEDLTLEGQIVRISDAVAYLNHDLLDAFRAGVLNENDLPQNVISALGNSHSQRINNMVSDIVESSWSASGESSGPQGELKKEPIISMSEGLQGPFMELREFMFQNVYLPKDSGEEGETARRIIRLLYHYFSEARHEIPTEYALRSRSEAEEVADFVSGMTDRYALRTAERIEPGISKIFSERLL
ncbi:MAG: deoxyguanosinetriphosphate triphosphohydrolase [Chloroflexi bacterium]|nr:deoxyguanosinetriphosphate triphosphohydrolase [Chloroflexota bacterium]MDA1226734.1 deoxyguanosinetriphosphate triphosphohydrolase [Chloroflexota bacterium]